MTVNVKSSSNVRIKIKHFSHTQQLLSAATDSKKYFEFLLQISPALHIIKKPLKWRNNRIPLKKSIFGKSINLITSLKNVEFDNFVSRMELHWSI